MCFLTQSILFCKSTISLSSFSRVKRVWPKMLLESQMSARETLYSLGILLLVRTSKGGVYQSGLQPIWKGPFLVLFSTSTAIKILGNPS